MQRSTMTGATSPQISSWRRAAVIGLVAGLIGAMAMAIFAMTAAVTYQDTGFFTPLYHIGSAFGSGESADAMSTSMNQATGSDLFYFTAGPAALGTGIHLITGAGWGLLFGLLVRAMRITRSAVVPVGVVFGILAMLVMSFGLLPAVAGLFDSGPAIRDMPSLVGWGTFSIEHAIFGLVLGLVGLAIASRSATINTRVPTVAFPGR
jgi:hypothetical protein